MPEEITRQALEMGFTEDELRTFGAERIQEMLVAADRRGFEAFRQQLEQEARRSNWPATPQFQGQGAEPAWPVPQPLPRPEAAWPAPLPQPQPAPGWSASQPQPEPRSQAVKFELDAEAYGLPPELTKQLQAAYDQHNQQLAVLQQALQRQEYMLQLQQQQHAEAAAREYAGWFDRALSATDDLRAVVGTGDYWHLPMGSQEARQREKLLEDFQFFAQYKGRDPFSRDDELLKQFLSNFVRKDPNIQQQQLSDKLKAASRKTIARPRSRHPDGRFAAAAEKDPDTGMPISGNDKIDEFLYATRGF
jgi:hypothetical protein